MQGKTETQFKKLEMQHQRTLRALSWWKTQRLSRSHAGRGWFFLSGKTPELR